MTWTRVMRTRNDEECVSTVGNNIHAGEQAYDKLAVLGRLD